MYRFCHPFIALTRAVGLVAVAGLTACNLEPRVSHTDVPDSVMRRLQASTLAVTGEGRLKWRAYSHAKGPVAVPLRFRYGLPCVDASINGASRVSLLVDTGSQVNVLEARTALAAEVQIVPPERTTITIIGTAGAEPALLGLAEKLDIGEWHLGNIPCLVRTHENTVRLAPWDRWNIGFNVLGMDVIRRTCGYVTLDYAAGQAVFGVARAMARPKGSRVWSAPLVVREGIPYVTLHTNGQPWTAMVDTGYNGYIEIEEKTAARLQLLDRAVTSNITRVGVGHPVGKSAPGIRSVMLPGLDSLGPRLVNIATIIVPDRSKIGSGLLRPFRVSFDLKRGLLWLEDRS